MTSKTIISVSPPHWNYWEVKRKEKKKRNLTLSFSLSKKKQESGRRKGRCLSQDQDRTTVSEELGIVTDTSPLEVYSSKRFSGLLLSLSISVWCMSFLSFFFFNSNLFFWTLFVVVVGLFVRFIANLPRRTQNGKRSSLWLSWELKKSCIPKPILRFFLLTNCFSKKILNLGFLWNLQKFHFSSAKG